jgi:hypothetical protein
MFSISDLGCRIADFKKEKGLDLNSGALHSKSCLAFLGPMGEGGTPAYFSDYIDIYCGCQIDWPSCFQPGIQLTKLQPLLFCNDLSLVSRSNRFTATNLFNYLTYQLFN